MKRAYILLALMIGLSGCAWTGEAEDPFRVDTVVRIPLEPTETVMTEEPAAETEVVFTEAAEETAAPTEAPKVSSGKASSGKGASSGSKKNQTPKTTQPAPTEPPVTQPPTQAPTEPPFDPFGYAVGSLEYAILDHINGYRAEAGASGLSMDGRLCGIAALRASEIAKSWSHTRPDGRDYTSAMSDHGYGYGFAAEHLIYVSGTEDAAAMVAKWMAAENSASLLSGSCTVAGIGVYRSGGVSYVACLLVG